MSDEEAPPIELTKLCLIELRSIPPRFGRAFSSSSISSKLSAAPVPAETARATGSIDDTDDDFDAGSPCAKSGKIVRHTMKNCNKIEGERRKN